MPVGTTSPFFVPRNGSPKSVKVGQGYLWIQIHSAQAAFRGKPWESAKGLVVTSQVNLHVSNSSEAARAIQRAREVKKNQATELGLNQNLVDIVPATMGNISVAIEFVLDRQNRLGDLVGLINNDTFWAAVSLAPGTALVARKVGETAQKIIQTFIPAQESVPILQFNGDFNMSGEGLREGYYVIIGSCDDSRPLPSPYEKLSIRNQQLLSNDIPVHDLSYVVLDVYCTEARTRDANAGAAWDMKLREAEDEAQGSLDNPLAKTEEHEESWKKCQVLLREAQALIRNDPNYLRREAESIVRASYQRCEKLVKQEGAGTRLGGVKSAGSLRMDTRMDRELLGIPQDDSALKVDLEQYAQEVLNARRAFNTANRKIG